MFTEKKTEVSDKAVNSADLSLTLVWCSFYCTSNPTSKGCWGFLLKHSLASLWETLLLHLSTVYVNRGIRRNVIFEYCLTSFCLVTALRFSTNASKQIRSTVYLTRISFPQTKFEFHKHKLSHFPNVCMWMEVFVLSFCNQYHKTFEGPWCICCTMLIQNKTLFWLNV